MSRIWRLVYDKLTNPGLELRTQNFLTGAFGRTYQGNKQTGKGIQVAEELCFLEMSEAPFKHSQTSGKMMLPVHRDSRRLGASGPSGRRLHPRLPLQWNKGNEDALYSSNLKAGH